MLRGCCDWSYGPQRLLTTLRIMIEAMICRDDDSIVYASCQPILSRLSWL
jgi:hypothetical protein